MNIECMFSKQLIEINEVFYLIPLSKVSSFKPVNLVKDVETFNILGMTESKCYTNAYYDYAGCLIQVKLNDNSKFELIENENNYNHFLCLLEKLSSNLNELSYLFIKNENYTFNQLNFILNKIFDLTKNGFIINNSMKNSILKFGSIKEKVIECAFNSKDLLLRKDKYFISLDEQIIKILNKYKEKKINISLKDYILFNLNFHNYYSEATMHLSDQYPFDLYNIFENLPEEVFNNLHIEEERKNLLNKILDLNKTYFIHVQLDVFFESLNFKLKPISFNSVDCSESYLKMVNFVKNKINKDIKIKYED